MHGAVIDHAFAIIRRESHDRYLPAHGAFTRRHMLRSSKHYICCATNMLLGPQPVIMNRSNEKAVEHFNRFSVRVQDNGMILLNGSRELT
jgi:hypothetical protein